MGDSRENNLTEKAAWKYVCAPVMFIHAVLTNNDRKCFILPYSVYNSAHKMIRKGTCDSIDSAFTQVLYAYNNQNCSSEIVKLTPYLQDKIEEWERCYNVSFLDEDYRLFNIDGSFDATNGVVGAGILSDIFNEIQKDQELHDAIIEFHTIRSVVKLLKNGLEEDGMDLTHFKEEVSNIDRMRAIWENYKEDEDEEETATFSGNWVKIYKHIYSDEENEYKRCLHAAYLAVRSILGKRKFGFVSRDLIVARMIGAKNLKEVDDIISKDKESEDVFNYYTRNVHHMKDLLEDLQHYYHVKIYARRNVGTFMGTDIKQSEFDKSVTELIKRMQEERKASRKHNFGNARIDEALGYKPKRKYTRRTTS